MTDEEIIGCSKLGEEFCSYYERSARALAIEVLALRKEVRRLLAGSEVDQARKILADTPVVERFERFDLRDLENDISDLMKGD